MRYIRQHPAKDEDGLVALFVVGIMIILLSLTTVAFTKLMGRESRQALDRALSTQAYYAAESGINDAKDYLNTHPQAVLSGSNCDTLSNLGYPPFLGPNSTDDVNKVTCVTADTTPQQLYFQIPVGKSRIFEMSSATNFGGLLFSWDNSNVTGYFGPNYKNNASRNFFPTVAWNGGRPATAPVLELSYYALPDTSPDLASQITASRTIFLYPSHRGGVGASSFGPADQDGRIVYNSCHQNNTNLSAVFAGATNVYHCNTIVTPSASRHIFVKVSAFYGPAALTVMARNTSNSVVAIQGAQAVLDSTGKGGTDVLKRLQTIVDYRPIDVEPGDTIETVIGLCKRLQYNLTTNTPQVDDPSPDADTSPACHTSDL